MSDDRRVVGYCPMGCGPTLFLGNGGFVTCSYQGCPDPAAVSLILDDSETEHVVEFKDDNFTIRHPLRERINDALLACGLHDYCSGLSGPPVKPGIYRAYQDAEFGTWGFEESDDDG